MSEYPPRVDGRAKVTGTATYTDEFHFPALVYGILVGSTIARGKIKKLDTSLAEKAPGVLSVISHKNKRGIYGLKKAKRAIEMELGLRIFHDKTIWSNGQPIALVVADTIEQAQHAASLVQITYSTGEFETDFIKNKPNARASTHNWNGDSVRGDEALIKKAPVIVEEEYTIPIEVHNPMEMHSTIAIWEGDTKLTLYDKNHAVQDVRDTIAKALGMEKEQVIVNSEFIGGGFGSGLRVWPHTFAAIMAAHMLKRPVKVTLSRMQMFSMVGYRPATWQKVTLGADDTGKLQGIIHEAIGNTSQYEEFSEGITGISKMMYACPNVVTRYKVVPLSLGTPIWMRGPGETPGAFALETAMDELSYKLNMDPIDLRKINFAEKHPEKDIPWSSNHLITCMDKGAAEFGWNDRVPQPGVEPEGQWMVGRGMATGAWTAWRVAATVRCVLDNKGNILLQSATSDMGPGTATAMVNIAAEALNMQPGKIRFELGKSNLPPSPGQGGSVTVASVGAAVEDACTELKKKLIELAGKEYNTYTDIKPDDIMTVNGYMAVKNMPDSRLSIVELLKKNNLTEIEVTKESKQDEEESEKYAFYTFAAHFAKVFVHKYTGAIRVVKWVSYTDAGKIISPLPAQSQMKGAAIMGIGMALMEQMHIDHATGRPLGADLAGYHIPAHADVPDMVARFVNEPDPYINKMGSKGLGEVGLIGAAAAIGNAVYNATGKRLRDLPMHIGKI